MWRWGGARAVGVCGIGAMKGAGPTFSAKKGGYVGHGTNTGCPRPKNKKHVITGDCFASLAMTTPCPAHHLEPAFLSIKNEELFFLPSVNQSSKDMRCFEASFTVGRGVSERVLSKVQGVYAFFKRLLM